MAVGYCKYLCRDCSHCVNVISLTEVRGCQRGMRGMSTQTMKPPVFESRFTPLSKLGHCPFKCYDLHLIHVYFRMHMVIQEFTFQIILKQRLLT